MSLLRSIPVRLLAITSLLLLSPSCEKDASTPSPPTPIHPVMLIGLDGIEWSEVLPMLERGELPNLAKLMQAGQYGTLETLEPTISPAIWTTVATGVSPEVHGITGFKTGRGRLARLANAGDRKVKAFWDIFTDHGVPAITIGWWLTWPVEPVEGVMVAQVNISTPDKRGTSTRSGKGALFAGVERQVHPPELEPSLLAIAQQVSDELPSHLEAIFHQTVDAALGPVPERLWAASLWAFRGDAIYRSVALELLGQRRPFQLFALYISGTDVVGHRFWRYMHPELYENQPDRAEVSALGGLVPAYYRWADQLVGEVIAAAPPETNIIIMSDHGMAPMHKDGAFEADDPNGKLVSAGHFKGEPCFFVAAGPDFRASGELPVKMGELDELGSVHDVLPTLLALSELPIGKDMEGEVMDDLLVKGFLKHHPLTWVPSHTPEGWAASRTLEAPAEELDDDRREQLQALGYIE
jgi:hypothetical protein